MSERAQVLEVPVGDLRESKFNHRRRWNLEELVPSIERHGVLQPLLARPTAKGLELVYGARRLRAAKEAKRETVPCEVREIDDAMARELIAVENGQREDVHALDEAELYAEMRDQDNLTGDDIAAKVGKSRSWVYGRLALADLCDAAKKALAEDLLSASIGVELARIHTPELQRKATKDCLEMAEHNGGVLSVRSAREHITTRYLLRLKDAPFDVGDASLLPKAGACTDCPKRTGNQTELFAEISGPDVCTDPPCFQKKRDALWKRLQAEAKKGGREVLSEKQARATFSDWTDYKGRDQLKHDAGFVRLDDPCHEDGKKRTYRVLLQGKDAPTVLGRAPKTGNIVELLPTKGLGQILKDAGVKISAGARPATRQATAAEKKQRQKGVAEKALAADVIAALVAAAEGSSTVTVDAWRGIAHGAIRNCWSDLSKDACRRRGLLEKGESPTDILHRKVNESPAAWCIGLVVELLASRGLRYALFRDREYAFDTDGFPATFDSLAQAFDVSVPKIRAAFKRRLATLERQKAAKKRPAKAKKKPAARRTTAKKATRKKARKKAARK